MNLLKMPKTKLKKHLYQLMAQSMAIQSLKAEERLEMQDKILGLPEGEMVKMVGILENEQLELAELHKRSLREMKEAKKLTSMAQSLRDAGRRFDKAFLTARESEEREESSETTRTLLDEIERL